MTNIHAEITELLEQQRQAYGVIDEYLEHLYKKATTEERINIRGVQRAINTVNKLEREIERLENL